MNVLISWSGKLSHNVGVYLCEWLKEAVPGVVPWALPEDVAPGSHRVQALTERLGSSRFRFAGYPYSPPVFSPDGRQLAVGGTEVVSVLDAATGRAIHSLRLPENHHPRMIRFLADGKGLAVGSVDWRTMAELTVYNLADGKAVGIDWTSNNLNQTWFGGSRFIPKNDTCYGAAWRKLIVDGLMQASSSVC